MYCFFYPEHLYSIKLVCTNQTSMLKLQNQKLQNISGDGQYEIAPGAKTTTGCMILYLLYTSDPLNLCTMKCSMYKILLR